ncbi:hypothetical protein MMC12_008101 [Toensbergia leucococca]|nr:hypothetical protein [Toensbergia leucococca]
MPGRAHISNGEGWVEIWTIKGEDQHYLQSIHNTGGIFHSDGIHAMFMVMRQWENIIPDQVLEVWAKVVS